MDEYEGGPQAYLEALAQLIEANVGTGGRVAAGEADTTLFRSIALTQITRVSVGECGLDYDRLHLCDKSVQLRNFPPQLELASRFDLPLFLHSRAAHADFIDILRRHNAVTDKPVRGVVHSHSESLEQALECIALGLYIGIK